MAYRAPVELRIPQERLQPQAAPVSGSTYVRPGVSQAQQLAEALGELNPKILGLSEQFVQRANEDQHERGIQAAREAYATGKKMSDLTRSGELPMQENAWFKAGLQEEMGRVLAGNFQSDFTAKLAQDPEYQGLRESTDLGDYDQAVEKARADFLAQNAPGADEFFQKGFSGLSTAYIQQGRLAFANGIEKKLSRQADATLHSRIMQVGREEFEQGRSVEEIAADVDMLAELTVARGRPEAAVMKTKAEALDALARQQEDPDRGLQLLKLFKHASGNGGGKLTDDPYASALLEKAENDLLTDRNQKEQREFTERKRAHQEQLDGFVNALAEDISNGGRGTKIIEAAPAEFKSDLIASASSLVSANNNRSASTNPWAYKRAISRIVAEDPGINPLSITHLPGIDGGDVMNLLGLYNRQNSAEGKTAASRLKAMPLFSRALSAIADSYKDPVSGVVPKERTSRVINAQGAFIARMQQSVLEGKLDVAEPDQTVLMEQEAQRVVAEDTGGLLEGTEIAPPRLMPLLPGKETAQAPQKKQQEEQQQKETAKSFESIEAQFELTADEWGSAFSDENTFNKAVAVAQRYGVPPDGLAEFFATMRRKALGK